MAGLSVTGTRINPKRINLKTPSARSGSLLNPNIRSNNEKSTKSSEQKAQTAMDNKESNYAKPTISSQQRAEIAKDDRIAKADRALMIAANKFSPEKGRAKIAREVAKAAVDPNPGDGKIVSDLIAFTAIMGNRTATLAKTAVDVVKEKLPLAFDEAIQEFKKETKEEDQRGGKKAFAITKKYSKMFMMTILPASLSLLISIFLIIVLIWGTIQWILTTINEKTGSNMSVPSITFDKKITQTVYSIFFVITSWFLMFYLVIDYYRNVGPELDIIQIGKQSIGALYILWAITVLIIGSGIAKAFYKISCNGNKPNVLSWAKIVESSALYVLGMTTLIMVFLLFKPIKTVCEKYFPILVKKEFDKFINIVRVTLKLMVIYILLRMLSIMIENVISNKLVFFISKLNKNVESPPENCNAEEEDQKAKQSEIARILEQIYMYISGFIVFVIIIFIIIIQCPHPWVGSTSKINENIGTVLLRLVDILTRFIVENKYGKIDCNTEKKGSSFLSSLTGSVGNRAGVPASDDSGAAKYSAIFKGATAPAATTATAPAATPAIAPAPVRTIKEVFEENR